MNRIDLNSDVGEGVGNEIDLMPYLTSCNIACGGHAGTVKTMREVLAFAKKFSVKIGAHPSYPDTTNFGREAMDISAEELRDSVTSQIAILNSLAKESGQILHHVKPHGALYNKAAQDEEIANLLVDAILEIDHHLKLYVPYGSVIAEVAAGKLETVIEGFADRAYNEDYSLVSRKLPNSVLRDSKMVIDHVLPMIQHKKLMTIQGKELPFHIDTLCVHGDTENAIAIVKDLHQRLLDEDIQIA